jgi:hypothetical protein
MRGRLWRWRRRWDGDLLLLEGGIQEGVNVQEVIRHPSLAVAAAFLENEFRDPGSAS